jgi:hypothetical protein
MLPAATTVVTGLASPGEGVGLLFGDSLPNMAEAMEPL